MNSGKGGQGQKVGRTIKEIELAAHRIDAEAKILEFDKKHTDKREFSYSLEDGNHYDMGCQEDRRRLLEKYGNGNEDARVYIVGITRNEGEMDRKEAIKIAKKCTELGIVPFIGHWFDDNGLLCEDISFTKDHGVNTEWARKERRRRQQKAVLEVTRGKFGMIQD